MTWLIKISYKIWNSFDRVWFINYEANTKFEFYSELKKIFDKAQKGLGTEDKFAAAIRRIGDVQYVALMGGFVGDATNQVDVFIVGEVDKRKLRPAMSELEKEIGREANYCVMSETEYEDRSMLFDRFVTEIMSANKKVIVDYLKPAEVE